MYNIDLSPSVAYSTTAQGCWLEVGKDSQKTMCMMSNDPEEAVMPVSALCELRVANCPNTHTEIDSVQCG